MFVVNVTQWHVIRVSNRISSRVRDGFGFEFSGFSVTVIILNYFHHATLQLCVNSGGPQKFMCPKILFTTNELTNNRHIS